MLDTVSRTLYKVTGIDRKPFQGKMGTISCETGKISIGLGPGLDGQYKFSVIETEKDILVLGMPWFEDINPRIDWKNKRLEGRQGRLEKAREIQVVAKRIINRLLREQEVHRV